MNQEVANGRRESPGVILPALPSCTSGAAVTVQGAIFVL